MREQFNIVNLFFEAANTHPDKPAIICNHEQITFGDLKKSVEETGNYFLSKGIEKGDRVMIFVPMSIDLYRTVLALFSIGATAVFLDEWVNKERMEICARIADCKAFIGNWKVRLLSVFSRELRKIPIKLGTGVKAVKQFPISPTFNEDTALITFTTGSTGVPKAAKRTHGFLNYQFDALIRIIDPQEDDVDMPVLPIVLLINLGSGSTSVITDFKSKQPQKLDVAATLETIRRNKVTRIVSSPYFVLRLAGDSGDLNVPSLRKIFTGGAPVFPSEASRLVQAFPGTKIEIVYGSTEAEPISSVNAAILATEDPLTAGGLNVGKIDSSATVRIIKIENGIIAPEDLSEFNQLELKIGEIGEIIVSGEHVLRAYFNNPEALKKNKIMIGNDCWHRTGDSGFLDNSGNLFLTGRSSNLIYWRGKIISPFIYEYRLRKLKDVRAGTILDVNDKVTIVIESNEAAATISVELDKAGIEYDDLQIMEKIPRDPRHNSKIDYELLKTFAKQM